MAKMNTGKMQRGVKLLLEGMGVDLTDRNYRDTPARVARMYAELFTPRANNFATFPEKHNSMVILRGHLVHGVCPHHLVPVEMRVYIAYIPSETVLGLSKLARVAEQPLTGPVLQEVYTDTVADLLDAHTRAKGVGVVVAGRHGCMRHRGIRSAGDIVTSAMRGQLLLNPSARQEFFQIIGYVGETHGR
jgi:GTP cyclohydrolase IA